MKEHLKKLCKASAIDPRKIEKIVDENLHLAIAVDIANSQKHYGFDHGSRSKKFPHLTDVGLTVPQSALEWICFTEGMTNLSVAKPHEVELRTSIAFDDGTSPMDAFETLDYAISAWERQAFPLVGLQST